MTIRSFPIGDDAAFEQAEKDFDNKMPEEDPPDEDENN